MTDVYKISDVSPNRKDRYFVDTNVWFWFTYCSSREIYGDYKPQRYQVDKYPQFVEKVLDEGAKLYHCPLVFSELANIIEKTEHEIYNLESSSKKISRKEFRAIPAERKKFVEELRQAWRVVSSVSNCIKVNLDEDIVNSTSSVLEESSLDAYDAFYFNIMKREGIDRIITDDRDFATTDVGSIYTANDRMYGEASSTLK